MLAVFSFDPATISATITSYLRHVLNKPEMSRPVISPSYVTPDTPPLPKKRILVPVTLSGDPSTPERIIRNLPRKNPLAQNAGRLDEKEALRNCESDSAKPIRTHTPAPIKGDIRLPHAPYDVPLFSLRNALVTVFSIFIGASLLASLLALIGFSGIFDGPPYQASITFQSMESFEIKPFSPSSKAVSPSEASALPLPGLPPVPSTRVVEPAAIPASAQSFTNLAAPDSLSPAPDLFIPDPFEPAPEKKKSKETSDQPTKEKTKETAKQPTNRTSGKTSNNTSRETTKRPSNQTTDRSATQPSANSQYGISELDGTPRLLRHGSAAFPSSLARQGVSRGTVVFEVELSTSGSVIVRSVVSSTHPELVAPARRVASGARFTPPKRNGKAVKAIMRWPIIIEK